MTTTIGLNLLWLVPGVVGGSEEYTMRLLAGLAERPHDDLRFVVFANRQVRRAYPDVERSYPVLEAPVTGARKGWRVVAEATWLGAAARRNRVSLLHHMGGVAPALRWGVPYLVTIHDLQPLAMPEHFNLAKRQFLRRMLPMSAQRARRVVTLTEYTRRDIATRLDVDPERISVVPTGLRLDDRARDPRSVRAAYGLGDRPYFLYPAITYPHKNHLVLLDALALLTADHPDAALVLTGGSAQMERAVAEKAQALDLSSRVFRLGRIPRDDLDLLYWGATALTFPSRFEGFGLPVLEAMSRDCPVIAADATALPEVVGVAGQLVPPLDAAGWAAAMRTMLDDPAARAAAVDAGRRRAATYTWEAAAAELEAVYQRAVLESRPSSRRGRD